MKGWVPRLKAASYANMVKDFLEKNPGMKGLELDRNLAKLWDSVDSQLESKLAEIDKGKA